MVASYGFVGGVYTFLGTQIGKMFSNYIAMAGFLHFLGTQIKKKMLQLYSYGMISAFYRFPNWKKRAQRGLKHELEIFKTRYRDWGVQALEFIEEHAFIVDVQVHKIIQSTNGKHEDNPHTKYPTMNKSGPSFEPSKWLSPLGRTIKHFQ